MVLPTRNIPPRKKSNALVADVGIGLKLNTEWGLRGNLAWAVQVKDKIEADTNDLTTVKSSSKIIFTLNLCIAINIGLGPI